MSIAYYLDAMCLSKIRQLSSYYIKLLYLHQNILYENQGQVSHLTCSGKVHSNVHQVFTERNNFCCSLDARLMTEF